MPVTVSYDLSQVPQSQNNDRTYLRSMFERLHWQKVGGSVFIYDGTEQPDGSRYEDWLNHVIPALMFMRSYVLRRNLQMSSFTIAASSVSFLDHKDPTAILGTPVTANPVLAQGGNQQCPANIVGSFLAAAIGALPAPPVAGQDAA